MSDQAQERPPSPGSAVPAEKEETPTSVDHVPRPSPQLDDLVLHDAAHELSSTTPAIALHSPELGPDDTDAVPQSSSSEHPHQLQDAPAEQAHGMSNVKEAQLTYGEADQQEEEQRTAEEPRADEASAAVAEEAEGEFEDVSLSRAPSVAPGVQALKEEARADFAELQSDTPAPPPTAPADDVPALDALPPPVPVTYSNGAPAATSSSLTSPPLSMSTTATSSPHPDAATRRESLASVTTVSAPGSSHIVSGILIVSSLESIAATKEAKRSKPLKDALEAALELLKGPVPSTPSATTSATVDPHLVFLPLRLACETRSLPLMITALDCLGKLVSYDFFVESQPARLDGPEVQMRDDDNESTTGGPAVNIESLPLADQITTTVCDCFSPSPTSSSSSSSSSSAQQTTQHDTLLLRLLSCLLSLILSSSLPVHQSALLKAVRTVYNVFLLGRAGTVQTVAQATLGQIVGGVFGRIELGLQIREAAGLEATVPPAGQGGTGSLAAGSRSASRTDLASVAEEGGEVNGDNASVEPATGKENVAAEGSEPEPETPRVAPQEPEEGEGEAEQTPKLPQQELETEDQVVEEKSGETGGEAEQEKLEEGTETPRVSVSGEDVGAEGEKEQGKGEKITTENLAKLNGTPIATAPEVTTNDLYVKDAFLVFRALCKLSMKPLGADSERDLKSPAMRSKLLSLHLILTILDNHMPLFVDPNVAIISSTSRDRTPFLTAVKQYLCLALSRNAVSPAVQVFELSCEIFSRMLSGMRQKLKKEIEVLLNEIFLPILEMRNSTVRQKSLLLALVGRLAQDPQALVDIYLNYDCDRSSLDNIYERLLNIVSKLGTTHFAATNERPGAPILSALSPQASPFPLAATSLYDESRFADSAFAGQPQESHIKRQSLECLVGVLRSLVSWAGRSAPPPSATATANGTAVRTSFDVPGGSEQDVHTSAELGLSSSTGSGAHPPFLASDRRSMSGTNTPDVVPADDPSRFENAKLRKTTLLEGIKKFNFKPKRGVAFLVETGFIRSNEPKDIARFLLHADGLDKAQIGEYLGEGEPENIATMHAFVDYMEFSNMAFVDALRMFLQSFRLPGEAQKIDRYMLKFAERFTAGNPGIFANADTAYILAFSVILLNTDAHNPQVKKPMSKVEFIKNNRGIDDGKDLGEDFLVAIYDEINVNEIRMKDEVEAAGPQAPAPGLAGAIATVGRDLQREAYLWQSESMVSKTEALFRTLVRGQRRGAGRASDEYYSASHAEHVKPMFEVVWMATLAGISGPLQDSDDIELIRLALDGFKQAIKIVCLFDLELERNAFVTTLAKFTFLNNFGEMRPKNVEAIKTLLNVAMVDGNYLKGSWREVLTCVSQLERFQLIAQGVDSQALPELGRKPCVAFSADQLFCSDIPV
ncbi:hypothetical protein JCM11641_001964 [Rhodosporidiobolus odoratus]